MIVWILGEKFDLDELNANFVELNTGKLDKIGDSKDNTTTFTEATTLANIATTESHTALFGKIKKFFTFIGTTTLTTAATTITTAINELVTRVLVILSHDMELVELRHQIARYT